MSRVYVCRPLLTCATGSSTATAYLTKTSLKRPNLTVGTGALAEKIVFSSENGRPRATGVVLSRSRGGPRYIATARREIIICAGSVNTPQLLMLSGIGPSKHLQDMDIPIVKTMPGVGQNLSDVRFGSPPITGSDNGCSTSLPVALSSPRNPGYRWTTF